MMNSHSETILHKFEDLKIAIFQPEAVHFLMTRVNCPVLAPGVSIRENTLIYNTLTSESMTWNI